MVRPVLKHLNPEKRIKMCVLHIKTNTDDIDQILSSTGLPVYQVYKKGEFHKLRKNFVFETNLISCSVSKKEWDDFAGQTSDMIDFLQKYQAELQSIKDNFVQIDWHFDLPYSCRINDETFNQNDYLPAELLLLSGRLGIGINLSLYPGEKT